MICVCKNGKLYGQNGVFDEPYLTEPIQEDSVVIVKLDAAFNISFAVDKMDKGLAYKAVAKDYSVLLYLTVGIAGEGACAEIFNM